MFGVGIRQGFSRIWWFGLILLVRVGFGILVLCGIGLVFFCFGFDLIVLSIFGFWIFGGFDVFSDLMVWVRILMVDIRQNFVWNWWFWVVFLTTVGFPRDFWDLAIWS